MDAATKDVSQAIAGELQLMDRMSPLRRNSQHDSSTRNSIILAPNETFRRLDQDSAQRSPTG